MYEVTAPVAGSFLIRELFESPLLSELLDAGDTEALNGYR